MKHSSSLFAIGAVLAGLSTLAQAQAPYTSATRYNVAGQVTGTMAPDPDDGGPLGFPATRNTYGLEGTPTAGLLTQTEVGQMTQWDTWSTFQAFQTRTFEYDDQGRKSAERVKGKNGTIESLVQYSYDSWDRVDCRVVRMDAASFSSSSTPACSPASPSDRISKFTYDDLDQVLTETRALETPLVQTYVTNTYQARGQLKTQEDAKGNLTTLEYENGRLKRRRYPLPANAHQSSFTDYNEYTYDNNGNATIERKRNGATITYTYDANNRLTFKNLSDNTYSQDISYGYDLRGLTLYSCFGATTACDASGEGETNQFDGFGNLEWRKSRMFGTTRQLLYQYDLEGNRSRITHPDGVYFTYERDGLNRVCTLGESASAPDCNSAEADDYLAIHYSAEGRRADIARPGSVTSYATNNALQIDVFTQSFTDSANNLTNGFDYNAAGQITLLTQSNTQYNYTEADNRTGSYGVNGLNQYTSIDGGPSITYDGNGNLTSDGEGRSYTYDMENHLVATGGSASSTLIYDVLGRLAQFSVNGTTTQFHYDGDVPVGEYVSGAMQRRYVHGDQVDEPLVLYTNGVVSSATRRYLHGDHQGSIIAQSDNGGAVAQRNTYDPNGIPATTNEGRFGYTGQTWLKELGLNYYKARIYSPYLGRFLQTDPIFYKDDMNLYAYVGGDPVNAVDPDGKEVWLAWHAAYGQSHAKIILIPSDQAGFKNHPDFQNRLPDGRQFAILSAGPNPKTRMLTSEVNRKTDVTETTTNPAEGHVVVYEGADTGMILNLMANNAAYKDNFYYQAQAQTGYNSNGYANGLLMSVGIHASKPPNAWGWENWVMPPRVPNLYFHRDPRKSSVTIECIPPTTCN